MTEAVRHYDEKALAALITAIALINVWNRLNVTTRQVAGEWVKSAEAGTSVEKGRSATLGTAQSKRCRGKKSSAVGQSLRFHVSAHTPAIGVRPICLVEGRFLRLVTITDCRKRGAQYHALDAGVA
jgi:hypothetical protein